MFFDGISGDYPAVIDPAFQCVLATNHDRAISSSCLVRYSLHALSDKVIATAGARWLDIRLVEACGVADSYCYTRRLRDVTRWMCG
ncbi:hypothetical protein A5719_21615 [Mycolicibacterium peregrinum]|nr:hypothetical protein A5719_21615 [Mycolicibacterium peregrinum]